MSEPTPRPEGVDAQTIYDWFHTGPGPTASEPLREGWASVGADYIEVKDLIHSALLEAGVALEGEGASAMEVAMSPLVAYADTAQEAALITGGAIERQGQDFVDTRNQVQQPQPLPDQPGITTDLVPIFDYAEAVRAQQEVTAQNQQAYGVYGNSTTGNMGILPVFPPPDPIGLDVSAPAPTSTQVTGIDQAGPQVTGAAAAGPSGAGSVAGQPAAAAPPPGVAPGPATGNPTPGGGAVGGAIPGSPGSPGAPGSGVGGRGGGVVPGPVPIGGSGNQGGVPANRWRRTVSPGLFGNSNASGGASGGTARGGPGGPGQGVNRGGGQSGSGSERPFGARGPAGSAVPAAGSTGAPMRGGPAGAGAGMPMGAGGARRGEDDQERTTKYVEPTDEHWDDDRTVVPPVIGQDEEPAPEAPQPETQAEEPKPNRVSGAITLPGQ